MYSGGSNLECKQKVEMCGSDITQTRPCIGENVQCNKYVKITIS